MQPAGFRRLFRAGVSLNQMRDVGPFPLSAVESSALSLNPTQLQHKADVRFQR